VRERIEDGNRNQGTVARGVFALAVVTVPLILLLGFASSRIAPAGAQNRWYAELVRPAMTPPDWCFRSRGAACIS